ncbi:MAG: acetyltransferase [Bacteroidetes bacterium]|nr:acetyltransferase [Bacteroidota bacterium]
MKESIILIGGGGHCKACIDVIEQEGIYSIAGIVDLPEKQGESILGYPVIGTDDDLKQLVKSYDNFLLTLGQIYSPERRTWIYQDLVRIGAKLPAIISPHAYVSKHSTIGNGTIIMHHALVNAQAKIGVNCIVNSKALIEHDVQIGDHCHISTGAIINGSAVVEHSSFIGSNAVTRESVRIPARSFIKANSLVK